MFQRKIHRRISNKLNFFVPILLNIYQDEMLAFWAKSIQKNNSSSSSNMVTLYSTKQI